MPKSFPIIQFPLEKPIYSQPSSMESFQNNSFQGQIGYRFCSMAFNINFRTIAAGRRLTDWYGGLLPIRTQVQTRRNQRPPNNTTIPVNLNLPDGLNFQWVDANPAQTTSAALSDLAYDLNVYTIYPTNLRIRDGNNYRAVRFLETYQKIWAVSHFTGIMIAEQIRFSTLQDSLTKPEYAIFGQQSQQWQDYFNFFYDNFKDYNKIYNQQRDIGAGPAFNTPLLNQKRVTVEIPVPYRAGP